MVDPFHIKMHKVSRINQMCFLISKSQEKKCILSEDDCQYHPDLPRFLHLSKDVNLEIAEQVRV